MSDIRTDNLAQSNGHAHDYLAWLRQDLVNRLRERAGLGPNDPLPLHRDANDRWYHTAADGSWDEDADEDEHIPSQAEQDLREAIAKIPGMDPVPPGPLHPDLAALLQAAEGPTLEPQSWGELEDEPDEPVSFILRGIMAEGQLAFVGGPEKVLKTRCVIAQDVAIVTNTPFLGSENWVPEPRADDKPRRCGLWSTESGKQRLKAQVRATLNAMVPDTDRAKRALFRNNFFLNPGCLPDLSDPASVASWVEMVKRLELDVATLDPCLLCLGKAGKDLANDAVIGEVLMKVQLAIRPCTLQLVHHANHRPSKARDWPCLNDLMYGWAAKFARQWMIIDREPEHPDYDDVNRTHHLRLFIGGSGGQAGGSYFARITEGHDWTRRGSQPGPF